MRTLFARRLLLLLLSLAFLLTALPVATPLKHVAPLSLSSVPFRTPTPAVLPGSLNLSLYGARDKTRSHRCRERERGRRFPERDEVTRSAFSTAAGQQQSPDEMMRERDFWRGTCYPEEYLSVFLSPSLHFSSALYWDNQGGHPAASAVRKAPSHLLLSLTVSVSHRISCPPGTFVVFRLAPFTN